MSKRTWRTWYAIRTGRDLAFALRKAKAMARTDHPDTKPAAMMTPTVRETVYGWDVEVAGKPD